MVLWFFGIWHFPTFGELFPIMGSLRPWPKNPTQLWQRTPEMCQNNLIYALNHQFLPHAQQNTCFSDDESPCPLPKEPLFLYIGLAKKPYRTEISTSFSIKMAVFSSQAQYMKPSRALSNRDPLKQARFGLVSPSTIGFAHKFVYWQLTFIVAPPTEKWSTRKFHRKKNITEQT
ncbi:hypothetical protein McpSp1_02760 [Methanocorpusculaceae archaeon Sp1]|nr:hypothetical protein [Methanocorpusculaceae archaeon Sp1]